MRNWNSTLPPSTGRGCAFSVFLWGIETCQAGGGPGQEHWFSVFLWGIETNKTDIQFIASPCFQSSYEELKHRWWSNMGRCWYMFSVFLWGIETGKKLSKNGLPAAFSVFLWGIETNGLRLRHTFISRFQSSYEELKLASSFLFFFAGKPFSVFLWGIETASATITNAVSVTGFQSSYEELKPLPQR